MGTIRRRGRQKRAARDSLQAALNSFEQIGARLWAERARAELARIGGRALAADALTPTEQRVAIRVARSIDADHAVRVLDQIVRERGAAPELMRMDNGPEMTANAVRDRCRLGGSGRSFIELTDA
jgi:hypothetical protein